MAWLKRNESAGKSKREKTLKCLLEIADAALYKAKSSTCLECGYESAKKESFIENKCPQCNSSRLEIGRNRVV